MDNRYTVVVALDDREIVDQLLRTATDLARWHDGRIHAVTVEHKPASSPFLLFSDESVRAEYAGDRPAILEQAARATELPVTAKFLVGSSVSETVRKEVERVGGDVLVLGWHERPQASDVVLGSTVDSLIRRPPCDTLVERVGTVAGDVGRVLVPTVGEPHLSCISNVATAIGSANDVTVTVLSVLSRDPSTAAHRRAERILDRAEDAVIDVPVEHRLVEADSSAAGILDVAEPTDVIVMGATGTGLVRPPVIGSVARTVGQDAPCPVIIGKEATGSRLQRYLSWL